MGSKSAFLNVYLNGRIVGQLEKTNLGQMRFFYDPSWLNFERSLPISLSLPLTSNAYTGGVVESYFRNLLPDSQAILNRIRSRLKISSTHPFDLLASIGRDCVGALQFLKPGETPETIKCTKKALSDSEIEQMISDYQGLPLGMNSDDDFRISIAGAQEKTALLRMDGKWYLPYGSMPTTHILKLPIGIVNHLDLTQSCENEWLCLQLASAYGFPIPNAQIVRFGQSKALVVQRFDREIDLKNGIKRLPTEDMCQALGVPADFKYEADGGPGIEEIFKLLKGSYRAAQDCQLFFAMQVFSWFIEAPDGHAKNYSIYLEENGRYRLTPFYDLLSASPLTANGSLQTNKIKLAMGVRAQNKHYKIAEIQPRHFFSMAVSLGLKDDLAEKILLTLAEKSEIVIDGVATQLPKDFPKDISEPVFESIKRKSQKIRSYFGNSKNC